VRHFERSREREEARLNALIVFGVGFAASQTGGEVDIHRLIQNARANEELKRVLPMLRRKTGFLQQFSLRRVRWFLAWIDLSRRQLPEVIVSGVTVLTFEQDARWRLGIIDRQDHD